MSAASVNSPFLAPSIKHSHSFLSNTKIRAAGSPARRAYDPWRAGPAGSSNSPFLAPSTKHSHSFLSNTRTSPARSPATRISTQSPRAHSRLSGKAISIEPSSSPDRSQVSAAGSIPSCSGVGLMTSSLGSYGFFATAQYSQREPSLSASCTSSAPHSPL